jgi:PIN domain nuclease of toxin-antitoxin system
MRVLLDTQVVLQMSGQVDRLGPALRAIVSNSDNELLFSAVSSWEIHVKAALGKFRLSEPIETVLDRIVAEFDLVELPIFRAATRHLARLPNLHRDPFDRMLVRQAIELGVPIATNHVMIQRYPIRTLG